MKLPGMIRTGARGLAAFALASSLSAEEPLLTRTPGFQIPFAVETARGGAPEGYAVLFGSRNGGPMEQLQRVPAGAGAFQFTAPADGTWQFAVRMTDATGATDSTGAPLNPELEVLVDTTPPQLELDVSDAGSGTAHVVWNVSEEITPESLSLEYAEGGDGRWKPMSIRPARSGQTTVQSRPGIPLAIRGQVADIAGNSGRAMRHALLAAAPPLPGRQPELEPTGGVAPTGRPAWGSTSLGAAAVMGPTPFGPSTPGVALTVPASAAEFPPRNPNLAYPPPDHSVAGPRPGFRTSPTLTQLPGPVVDPSTASDFESGPATAADRNYSASAVPATGHQLVSSSVFHLAYQVEGIGPSGVSAVELFLTEDNGQQWYRYGNDSDLKSPILVDVQGEGTFGFAIRVRNGVGFSDPPPQPGEAPEIVVTVDQTPPLVNLGSPEVKAGGNASVLIPWTIRERVDVRLEYATSSAGPWVPLFDWQTDRNSYEWAIRPNLPPSVYFRLLARDAAGNISSTQTQQPTVIDLQLPRARMLGVQPASASGIGY